jgi:protein gp37
MGAITRIAWCDATFNPWIGCQRVSTACDRCYAAALSWRYGWRDGNGRDLWDVGADRKRTSSTYWRTPLRWNERAHTEGTRRRVFCASIADVFDNKVPTSWRVDLWSLIRATPALDWLLLTKRPQNIRDMLPKNWGVGWPNVWLGTTAENQQEANRRIPYLVAISAAVRFLSVEPMLGPVDLTPWMEQSSHDRGVPISWVIVGGESGGGARPMHPDWIRDLRNQVHAAGAKLFVKQIGGNHSLWPSVTGKGEDPAQWPADLRMQDIPQLNPSPDRNAAGPRAVLRGALE